MDYLQKIQFAANSYYNRGLEMAKERDLSGAALYLKRALQFNKYHTDARNLLGLIFYEMGETSDALTQWSSASISSRRITGRTIIWMRSRGSRASWRSPARP